MPPRPLFHFYFASTRNFISLEKSCFFFISSELIFAKRTYELLTITILTWVPCRKCDQDFLNWLFVVRHPCIRNDRKIIARSFVNTSLNFNTLSLFYWLFCYTKYWTASKWFFFGTTTLVWIKFSPKLRKSGVAFTKILKKIIQLFLKRLILTRSS